MRRGSFIYVYEVYAYTMKVFQCTESQGYFISDLSFWWTKTVAGPHDIWYLFLSSTRSQGVLRAVVNVTTRAPGRSRVALSAIAAKVSSAKQVELAKIRSPSDQSHSGSKKEPYIYMNGS